MAGRTSGNPLFVSEMARLAAARGAAVPRWSRKTAQGAIRRRVARLPQPAQHVLTVAAVLGQESSLDPVRTLAGLDPDAFAAGLDAVVASGLAPTRVTAWRCRTRWCATRCTTPRRPPDAGRWIRRFGTSGSTARRSCC